LTLILGDPDTFKTLVLSLIIHVLLFTFVADSSMIPTVVRSSEF